MKFEIDVAPIAARLASHYRAAMLERSKDAGSDQDDNPGVEWPAPVEPVAAQGSEMATRAIGEVLALIGGRSLLHAVIDAAEDAEGVTIAAWLHRVWVTVELPDGTRWGA